LVFRSTNAYVAHLSRRIFEESGLYPHTNVGVMDEDDFELLRPVTLSMGLMLETTADVPAHRNSREGPGGED